MQRAAAGGIGACRLTFEASDQPRICTGPETLPPARDHCPQGGAAARSRTGTCHRMADQRICVDGINDGAGRSTLLGPAAVAAARLAALNFWCDRASFSVGERAHLWNND